MMSDQSNDKRFLNLRANFALQGWELSRTDAADGPIKYFLNRWGRVRELKDLAAVAQVAGSLGMEVPE